MRRRSERQAARERELADLSRRLRDRSRGRCELAIPGVCDGLGTEVHHVLLRSQGGQDTEEDCVWACWSCHRHTHSRPAEAYENGWLRRRWPA